MLINNLKSFKYRFLCWARDFLVTHGRHYPWPRRLHSRMYSWEKFYKNTDIKRVNLGAGPYFNKDGWITVDLISDPKYAVSRRNYIASRLGDEKLTVSNIDICYTSHFLEHLNINQGAGLIKSVFAGMNSGGIFRIVVPDAKLVLERYLEDDLQWFEPIMPILRSDGVEFNIENSVLVILCQAQLRNPEALKLLRGLSNVDGIEELAIRINMLSKDLDNDEEGRMHLTSYTPNILMQALRNAGFSKVYQSFFMGSRSPEMREVPIYDGTHPWLSLYIEAIK